MGSKHFTDEELHAEWVRAAYVVGVFGPHIWGRYTATVHRFLLTPHARFPGR